MSIVSNVRDFEENDSNVAVRVRVYEILGMIDGIMHVSKLRKTLIRRKQSAQIQLPALTCSCITQTIVSDLLLGTIIHRTSLEPLLIHNIQGPGVVLALLYAMSHNYPNRTV